MDKSDTATNMNSHGRQLKAAVFYFSGTGTTEIAARHTVDCLEKRGYDASLIRIEDFLKRQQEIDIRQYALIGIGSQVIAFDTPGIVLRFVKKLPAGNNARTFIFRLAGGVAPINFNASNKLKRMLKRKGYDVFHERLFSIGSNWMVKFDDRIVHRLYYSTMSKIDSMCDDIAEGQPRVLKTGLFSRILMGLVGFAGHKIIPLAGKDHTVNDSCTHCGKCVRNCPANNITEKHGKIRFGFSCNCCMRCIYSCPEHAIRLRLFSFFEIPGGKYNIEEAVESGIGEDGLAGVNKPPFFDHYISDPTA